MMTYIGCEEGRGGAVRERESESKSKASGGVGEIPSAYQSVYLALHVPSLWEGKRGRSKGAKSKRGKDDIRMEGNGGTEETDECV